MLEEILTALVVDDVAENRLIFSLALQKLGFKVIEVENGKRGLEILQNHQISVIFLDYEMPGMTGFEFLTLRKITQHTNIPVIMISTSIACNVKAVEDYGAQYWIHKPPLPHEVEEALIMVEFYRNANEIFF